MDFFQNKLPHTGRISQTHKRLQQNESVTSIPGFRGSDNSASVGLEPEPWLSQRFIAGLIWLYRVYRQLRETRQRQNEMESLMKEIYFGLRFDNLYSLLPPPCSAEPLQMLCASFFFFFFPLSLLFHNFFSISSTCLLWWHWDKISGCLEPLKWFIATETRYNSALRPEIKHWRTSAYKRIDNPLDWCSIQISRTTVHLGFRHFMVRRMRARCFLFAAEYNLNHWVRGHQPSTADLTPALCFVSALMWLISHRHPQPPQIPYRRLRSLGDF